ncbi:hypothetical protein AGDE_16398 [Angomonas deanei]|uniref:Uncharacterized protein n=1 Tax=Angomonas deanei TaxID=59799 RepID=A0A7G2C5T4_9TRYP|nr:hypothetical protein AGDE_16398 [Angomonas deanei]CAD2215158.1 hypothetical protein, conserved [Angomonas deanei]|eukprot:EPY17146.1 hypothetical protein AGDE_16398 [Angomonas deanei]
MTATQEELTKRAARFGLTLQVPHQPVKTVHVDEAVLASRAARFHMADTGKETLEARAARFAPKADPVIDPSTLSEEARAALEQRARRFGML